MGTRLNLHEILKHFCANVYFQPPASIQLKYPCIVYQLSSLHTNYANNRPYVRRKNYTITVIDRNPDSDIPDKLSKLPTIASDRVFTSDNLNHFVFRLYY